MRIVISDFSENIKYISQEKSKGKNPKVSLGLILNYLYVRKYSPGGK